MKTETGNVHAGFFPRSISLFRIFLQKTLCVPRQSPPRMNCTCSGGDASSRSPPALRRSPWTQTPRRLGLQETMLRPRRADRRLQGWAKSSRQLRIHSMISVFYSTEANFWVIFSLAVMWFNKRDRCNQIILRNECFKKKISIWTNPHLALRV